MGPKKQEQIGINSFIDNKWYSSKKYNSDHHLKGIIEISNFVKIRIKLRISLKMVIVNSIP